VQSLPTNFFKFCINIDTVIELLHQCLSTRFDLLYASMICIRREKKELFYEYRRRRRRREEERERVAVPSWNIFTNSCPLSMTITTKTYKKIQMFVVCPSARPVIILRFVKFLSVFEIHRSEEKSKEQGFED
jgi:hypothetical protein